MSDDYNKMEKRKKEKKKKPSHSEYKAYEHLKQSFCHILSIKNP